MKHLVLRLAFGIFGLAGMAPAVAAAQESCSEATIGSCYSEYLSIPALAATPDGYTAVAVAGNELEILRLDADGQIVDRFLLASPQWRNANQPLPAIEKLVTGPDGDVMGVGTLTSGSIQYGAYFILTAAGNVQWSTPLRGADDTSLFLYSGAYDPDGHRYLAVGRHTNGADTGSCTKWAQGLILSIAEKDASSLRGFFDGDAQPGLGNRTAYYDIAPTGNRGQFAIAGFGTAAKPGGDGCQDNAIAVLMRGGQDDNNRWNVSSRYVVGSPGADEDAFAIVPAGDDAYLMGGQGIDQDSGARAAFLSAFSFNNSAPDMRYDPFPQDGSDNSGGDRYRVLLALGDGSFIAAGSVSESRRARNKAVWRVQPAGLATPGPLNFLTKDAGSDIFSAALGSDGRVLAVGKHGGGNTDVGWIGFIYGQKITVSRRAPDASLELLTPKQASAGAIDLSEREIAAGTGFRDIRVRAGSEYEVRFKVSDKTDLAAAALPADGDIDLALLDNTGKLRAFSSNLNDAGEYLLSEVPPGDYRLRVIAVTDVGEYELKVKTGVSLATSVLDSLNALDAGGRAKLASLLEDSGYITPANAQIAFGGGSLRSLLAYYNTFNTLIDAGGVQQFITSASLSADQEE